MGKVPRSYRLDEIALKHLEAIEKSTGSNHTAIIEQALAVYHALLRHGTLGEAVESEATGNPCSSTSTRTTPPGSPST